MKIKTITKGEAEMFCKIKSFFVDFLRIDEAEILTEICVKKINEFKNEKIIVEDL